MNSKLMLIEKEMAPRMNGEPFQWPNCEVGDPARLRVMDRTTGAVVPDFSTGGNSFLWRGSWEVRHA